MGTISLRSASAAPIPETLPSLIAAAEGRAVVTIDTDFGALVFRDGATRVGVLGLRERAPAALADRASELVEAHGDDLESSAFVTDDGDSVRVTPRART